MKRLLLLFASAAAMFFAACSSEFDDTEIWNSINSLEQRMSAMETVMNAYKNDLHIKSVNQIEGGYVITFSDGSQATIMDGEDGKDGDTYIESIIIGDNEVTFVLTDGQKFSIPLYSALSINFDTEDLVVMAANSTRDLHYTVESILTDIKVEVISSSDIKAKVIPATSTEGIIQIITGGTIDEYSKVVVFVSNGEKVIMRSITFEEPGLVVEENTTKQVAAEGGEMTLEFLSNVECEVVIPEDAQSWISVVPGTRALTEQSITLKLEPNEGLERSSELLLKSINSNLSLVYTIKQELNDNYQFTLEREALIAFYKATDGDNWLRNWYWCSDKPISQWYGIKTDSEGHIITIDLNHNQLSGYIPTDIVKLSNLKVLLIAGNKLTGNIPSELGELNNLLQIDCGVNKLTGTIPKELGNLPNLKSVSFYDNQLTGSIPAELGQLSQLKTLFLANNKLTGSIPAELGQLSQLQKLILEYNQLTGSIPAELGQLSQLQELRLECNQLTGSIPAELGQLSLLEVLKLCCNQLTGSIPAELGQLSQLQELRLECNQLTGSIPAELGFLSNLSKLHLHWNHLTGDIPQSLINHNHWINWWHYIIAQIPYNGILVDNTTIPAPTFDITTTNGDRITHDIYSKQELTILFGFNSNCGFSIAFTPTLLNIYNKYKDKGVEILCYSMENIEKVASYKNEFNIPWHCFSTQGQIKSYLVENLFYYPKYDTTLIIYPNLNIVDKNGYIIFNQETNQYIDTEDFLATYFSNEENDNYTSTDYSQDGVVTALQTATVGDGIDIVLMGDAYSDRQIADGTYKTDMEYIYNNLFTEEPYKSFKDYFNVYYVNVVSATEGYEYGNTALDGYWGDGTLVGGNDNAVFDYALKAISDDKMDEALLIVAMNSDNYAGTCYMYSPTYSIGDHGSGASVAYFPRGGNAETFAQLLHHEACGHGFAKLADEYAYEEYGTIPAEEIQEYSQMEPYGWWKNVDLTSDPTKVKWAHFLSDTRYANDGLGVFEGGLTYWRGVWRPTENSIMRYNTGGFNAPSREAIYYRIHKLAYGDSWEYDYEEFVEWDARNRTTAATRAATYRPSVLLPTHPPVVVNKSWRDAK
ncbi:MAG: redoxin domain-containing protein [Alistipes sp.]|nr:redoxin domain-containing protein [Alistipes sp.]